MSDRPSAAQVKTLTIVACNRVHTGTDKRGEEFHIYEVQATRPDGAPVDQKLNTFEELPVGETLELTVKPYNGTRGMSYTLARKNKISLKQRVAELESRLEKMETVIRRSFDEAGKPLP